MMIIDLRPRDKDNIHITHEEMIEQVNQGVIYDGFLGGIEESTEYVESVTYEEDGETRRLLDYFPHYRSLDGTKIAVRVCSPVTITSWYHASAYVFERFLAVQPIEKWLTKSEFQQLIDSAEYTEHTEVV